MNTEAYDGIEAWRSVVHHEEPTTCSAQVEQLPATLQTKLEYWEYEVQKFEVLICGAVSDALHQALPKSNDPRDNWRQVEMTNFPTAR